MNSEFMDALEQLEREKGIAKDILLEAIELALISGYKKNFNSAQNVRVDINRHDLIAVRTASIGFPHRHKPELRDVWAGEEDDP